VTDPKSQFYVPPDRPVFNGRVIVLANQNTHSAAAILATLIQDNKLATVVGTTTDNNSTGPTGLTLFQLPRTKLRVSLPLEYYERPIPANGEIFKPDYWIEESVEDLLTGRDATFEKGLELIRKPQ
jgi:C-terminal processing protease CtpA/Prc